MQQLINNQTLDLVQLLYKTRILTQQKKHRLKYNFDKIKIERQQNRIRLQTVIDSEIKYRVEQNKRYQIFQNFIINNSALRMPQYSIYIVNNIDISLRYNYLYCADCINSWNQSYCLLCKKFKNKFRQLYFSWCLCAQYVT